MNRLLKGGLAALLFFLSRTPAYAANIPLFSPGYVIVPKQCQVCPCGAGSFLQFVQNVLNASISLGVLILILLTAYVGIVLILAPTNPEAQSRAKGFFSNAFRGFFILLVAWLLVDTGMKLLYDGRKSHFGPWNEILSISGDSQCISESNNFTSSSNATSSVLSIKKGVRPFGIIEAGEVAPLGTSAVYPPKTGVTIPRNSTYDEGVALLKKDADDPSVTLESSYAYLPNAKEWWGLGSGDRISTSINLGNLPEIDEDTIFVFHLHPYDVASYKPAPPSALDIFGAAYSKINIESQNNIHVRYFVVDLHGVWEYEVQSNLAAQKIIEESSEESVKKYYNLSDFFQIPVIKKDLETLLSVNSSSSRELAAEFVVVERALQGEYGAVIKKKAEQVYGNSLPNNFYIRAIATEYHYYHGEKTLSDYISFYESYGAIITQP
jgi:hypothetical protein